MRRQFTQGYLKDEADRLGSPHYSPATMVETDREMIDFFHWMADLPQNIEDRGSTAVAQDVALGDTLECDGAIARTTDSEPIRSR